MRLSTQGSGIDKKCIGIGSGLNSVVPEIMSMAYGNNGIGCDKSGSLPRGNQSIKNIFSFEMSEKILNGSRGLPDVSHHPAGRYH
jgi:hypothetical protein